MSNKEQVAERFQDEGYGGEISLDSIGSTAGRRRFCAEGVLDIANASRAITRAEIEACRGNGRDPIEFRVCPICLTAHDVRAYYCAYENA